MPDNPIQKDCHLKIGKNIPQRIFACYCRWIWRCCRLLIKMAQQLRSGLTCPKRKVSFTLSAESINSHFTFWPPQMKWSLLALCLQGWLLRYRQDMLPVLWCRFHLYKSRNRGGRGRQWQKHPPSTDCFWQMRICCASLFIQMPEPWDSKLQL